MSLGRIDYTRPARAQAVKVDYTHPGRRPTPAPPAQPVRTPPTPAAPIAPSPPRKPRPRPLSGYAPDPTAIMMDERAAHALAVQAWKVR